MERLRLRIAVEMASNARKEISAFASVGQQHHAFVYLRCIRAAVSHFRVCTSYVFADALSASTVILSES